MQDIPDDQDLQQLATLSLLQLARFVYPAQLMPQMVDMFYRILKDSTSWHVRSNVLPVVQIFFYTNLFSMDVAMMVKVMDAVSGMLLDPQIEVWKNEKKKRTQKVVDVTGRFWRMRIIAAFLLSTGIDSFFFSCRFDN